MKPQMCVYLTVTTWALLLFPVEAMGFIKTLVTYNTALLEWLGSGATGPTRIERRDAIIQALNSTYADAICLQEVWFGEDVHKIAKDLETRFPYSYSPIHNGTTSDDIPLEGLDPNPPCPATIFMSFAGCLQTNCPDASEYEALAGCILSFCAVQFAALPQECWTCFSAAGPKSNDIMLGCTGLATTGPYRQMNLPGLLLLSRRPMWDAAYTDLHPGTREVFEVGYLEAKVWNLGQLVCTHTSFYESDVYYELELQAIANISSWVQQGRLEINTLVERFADKRRLFLLGDFNVGPGMTSSGIAPFQPEIYSILTNAFCVDPVQQCTYCDSSENLYNGNSTETARIIDHIFYKGYMSLMKRRIFDDVTIGDGYPLSDHFGVMQHFIGLPFSYRRRRPFWSARFVSTCP